MADEDRVEPTLAAGAASAGADSTNTQANRSAGPPKSKKKLFIILGT